MPADVLERRVEVVHDADREDQVEILRVPVRVGRGPSGGHEHPRRGTAAELDTRVGEEPPRGRQGGRRGRGGGDGRGAWWGRRWSLGGGGSFKKKKKRT